MKKKKEKSNNKFINKLLIKIFVCCILFLIFLIFNKKIDSFHELIYNNIYNSNISFAKINKIYESYFGSILPVRNQNDVQVFNESLIYKSKEKYLDGALLNVENNYIVPSISNGIVIFIGEKDKYGKTIIIQDEEGIDIWYSNINIGNINMYDYISKGDFLGEVIDNKLIMIFEKKGKILDYNKYI